MYLGDWRGKEKKQLPLSSFFHPYYYIDYYFKNPLVWYTISNSCHNKLCFTYHFDPSHIRYTVQMLGTTRFHHYKITELSVFSSLFHLPASSHMLCSPQHRISFCSLRSSCTVFCQTLVALSNPVVRGCHCC